MTSPRTPYPKKAPFNDSAIFSHPLTADRGLLTESRFLVPKGPLIVAPGDRDPKGRENPG